jgi:hypothetical protein
MKDIDVYIKEDHVIEENYRGNELRFIVEWGLFDEIKSIQHKNEDSFDFLDSKLHPNDTELSHYQNESSPEQLINVVQYNFGTEEKPIAIDHITVHHNYKGNIIDYVNHTFDISICKNVYDGKQLYISNISHLINKCFEYNSQANVFGIAPYVGPEKIDFEKHVKGELDIKSLNDHMVQRATTRIERYISRGFTCISKNIDPTYKPIDKNMLVSIEGCDKCKKLIPIIRKYDVMRKMEYDN